MKCGFSVGYGIIWKYWPLWISVSVLDLNQNSGFSRTLLFSNTPQNSAITYGYSILPSKHIALLEISTWWKNQKCLSLAFFACQIVAKSMKKSLNECSYTLPSSTQAWLIFNKKVDFSISRTIFLTRGQNIFKNKI